MSRIDLQPVTAQAGITAAQSAANVQADVVATFGRIWAYWTDSRTSAGPLMFWMKSLTECGFSAEECEAVLHDIEVADPEAVAICRERREQWLPEVS